MTRRMSVVNLVLSLFLSMTAYAGNGVERGRLINGTQNHINFEILNYINRNLIPCQANQPEHQFYITQVNEARDKIDNGITDIYYQMQLKQISSRGQLVGQMELEILDSDFHNWKDYAEKLSFKVLNKKGNFCH